MIGKPYFGLRRCEAHVPVLFPRGEFYKCSNPASRVVGEKLLCANHVKRESMKVTIEFERDVLDGIEAAKLVLAVKRAMTLYPPGYMGPLLKNGPVVGADGTVPIIDEHGVVLGRWRQENAKKKKEAA